MPILGDYTFECLNTSNIFCFCKKCLLITSCNERNLSLTYNFEYGCPDTGDFFCDCKKCLFMHSLYKNNKKVYDNIQIALQTNDVKPVQPVRASKKPKLMRPKKGSMFDDDLPPIKKIDIKKPSHLNEKVVTNISSTEYFDFKSIKEIGENLQDICKKTTPQKSDRQLFEYNYGISNIKKVIKSSIILVNDEPEIFIHLMLDDNNKKKIYIFKKTDLDPNKPHIVI